VLAPVPAVALRAVGIIRVSRVGKRAADRFISPEDQLKAITQLCERQAWTLVQLYREIDQSGYRTRFEKRRGLYPATRMIENGEADVIVLAFFDRMARNIIVQTEFLGRIGRAGGKVWAADLGEIQTGSAVAGLSTGMLGLVAQFMAESTAEKTQGPKERAISLGIPTFPHIPAGYRLGENRQLVVFEPEAKLVRQTFERRQAGASYHELRDWLRSQGLVRSTRGVQELLKNRIYLGELRFGRSKSKGGSGVLVNLHSHTAIVDRGTFDSVQKMRVAKGPRGDAESIHTRLLSRQGVLRCASCNRAMIVSANPSHGRIYIAYRCPPIGDCSARVSIMSDKVDAFVGEWMKEVQAQGSYSANEHMATAQAELAAARDDLQQAMRNLATFRGTAQARTILDEYQAKAEAAEMRVDQLRSAFGPSAVRSMTDWDKLPLAERRDLVRAIIKRILVRPGRGMSVAERVSIEAFLE
jgi:DNA invertase Pin-like site-specific DNA recombinase